MITHLVVALLLWAVVVALAADTTNTMDRDLLQLSIRAMELTEYVGNLTPDKVIDLGGAIAYVDGPHAALFVAEHDKCFLVFSSTIPGFSDWYVNFEPFNDNICSPRQLHNE